VGTDSLFRR